MRSILRQHRSTANNEMKRKPKRLHREAKGTNMRSKNHQIQTDCCFHNGIHLKGPSNEFVFPIGVLLAPEASQIRILSGL